MPKINIKYSLHHEEFDTVKELPAFVVKFTTPSFSLLIKEVLFVFTVPSKL